MIQCAETLSLVALSQRWYLYMLQLSKHTVLPQCIFEKHTHVKNMYLGSEKELRLLHTTEGTIARR